MTDDGVESSPPPPPEPKPPRRVGRLDTIKRVRKEMVQVYRDMHEGRIKSRDGTSRAFVLTGIQKAIEFQVMEKRLAELEKAITRSGIELPSAASTRANGRLTRLPQTYNG
jgi:hypothetical protein